MTLIAGEPVLQSTSELTICKHRNITGECIGDLTEWESTQGTFFELRVAKTAHNIGAQLSVGINRDCVTGECGVGMMMYLSSCHEGEDNCQGKYSYPSHFDYKLAQASSKNERITTVGIYVLAIFYILSNL